MKELDDFIMSIENGRGIFRRIIDWVIKIITGNAPYRFEHNHNKIRSNVDKITLLKTLNESFYELGIESICVQYNDGFVKVFKEKSWHAFGNNVLKNCHKIKVIVIHDRKKDKR